MTTIAKMCNVHRLDVLTDQLKKFVCNYDTDRRTKVKSGVIFSRLLWNKSHTQTLERHRRRFMRPNQALMTHLQHPRKIITLGLGGCALIWRTNRE
jgi:hypothetical protein